MGFFASRYVRSLADYLISGRELGSIITALGFVAIIVSGAVVAATPKLAVIRGFWGGFLFPTGWAIGAIIYAFTLAILIRRSGVTTTSEWLRLNYGPYTQMLTALVIGFASAVFFVQNQLMGMGSILAGLGVDYTTAVIAVGLVVVIYTALSGLWGVVLTDVLQYILAALFLSTVPLILAAIYNVPLNVPPKFFALPDSKLWS